MYKYLVFILSGIIILNSCTEIYEPELKNAPRVLVIEGLITNENKEQTILLSKAIPFDTLAYIPETGANVYVTDENGNQFVFNESLPGTYKSDLSFVPQYGIKYYLTVQANNKIYQSSAQEFLLQSTPPIYTNTYKTIEIYKKDGIKTLLINVEGGEFIASINNREGRNYYRFSSSILTEFTSITDNENIWKYCWKKYNPNQYFSINNSANLQHDLGFFPLDTSFYGVVKGVFLPPGPGNPKPIITERYLKGFYLSIKQYHINENTYKFYESLNKQLEAEQRFFDPISAQIIGNIRCISDTTEKVFGIFEAASVNISSFQINHFREDNYFQLKAIAPVDMDSIPDSGENPYVPPSFWLN